MNLEEFTTLLTEKLEKFKETLDNTHDEHGKYEDFADWFDRFDDFLFDEVSEIEPDVRVGDKVYFSKIEGEAPLMCSVVTEILLDDRMLSVQEERHTIVKCQFCDEIIKFYLIGQKHSLCVKYRREEFGFEP